MALGRNLLTGMGLTDEQVEAIIEAHTDSIKGIKTDRDKYRSDAEQVEALKAELEELKANDSEGWQKKYEAEHEAFESYKLEQEEKEANKVKQDAFRTLLEKAGISKTAIDNIVEVTNLADVKLTKDGALKDADELSKSVKEKWSGFITETKTEGAKVVTPPDNNAKAGATYSSKSEIMAIQDGDARRQAIKENPQLFVK